MAKRTSWVTLAAGVGAVALLVIALAAVGVIKPVTTAVTPTGQTTIQVSGSGATGCPLTSTDSNTFTAYDLEQRSTSVTGTYTLYDDAGAFYTTATKFVAGKHLTSYASNSSYYGTKGDFTTACGGSGVKQYLALLGTVSVNVINKDGVTVNGNSSTLAVGTSESVTLRFEPRETTAYAYWGNPELNYYDVALRFANVSEFDLTKTSIQGNGAYKVATSTLASVTGDLVEYRIPKAIAPYTTQYGNTVTLSAATGVNPAASNQSVIMDFMDSDYYVDSLTQKVENGVNTDRGAGVGATNVPVLIAIT